MNVIKKRRNSMKTFRPEKLLVIELLVFGFENGVAFLWDFSRLMVSHFYIFTLGKFNEIFRLRKRRDCKIAIKTKTVLSNIKNQSPVHKTLPPSHQTAAIKVLFLLYFSRNFHPWNSQELNPFQSLK